jgi:hypothetical protein
MWINGVKIFYQAEDEFKKESDERYYPESIEEWLARWDDGKQIPSLLEYNVGPHYQQRVQITAVEIVRWFIANCIELDPTILKEKIAMFPPLSKCTSRTANSMPDVK